MVGKRGDMKQTVLCAFMLLAVTLSFTACQNHSTDPRPDALVKLGFELESSDFATLVNLVTLTVTSGGETLDVDTLNLVEGVVNDTLTLVPDQTVTLLLEAFRSSPPDEPLLLYSADTTLNVVAGPLVTLDLLLVPPPDLLMLRAGPIYQSSTVGGDPIEVFVDVYNVTSLWGASFRLEYDTTMLEFNPDDAVEGSFVSDDESVPTLGFVRDSLDFISGSVVRLLEDGVTPVGASGSGRLLTFSFTPIGTGSTEIRFIRNSSTPKLSDPDLNPVTNFENVVLEPATVEVFAGSR
jgi:hypothetical protein